MKIKEAIETAAGKVIFSKDLDIKGAKTFIHFESYPDFVKVLNKKGFKSYYELFQKDKPWNFVIDLDLKKDHQMFEKSEELLEDLIERFWSNIDDYAGFECEQEQTVVLVSPPTESKKSYHIIFRIKNVYFRNHLVCKDFASCFEGEVDNAIYTSNRSFRTLYSAKLANPTNFLDFHPMTSSTNPLDSFGSLCEVNSNTKYIEKRKTLSKKKGVLTEKKIIIDTKDMVLKLNPFRYKERNHWLEVAFILKGISEDSEYFHLFSKQWESYEFKSCEDTFNSVTPTLDSTESLSKLIYLYNMDNPDDKFVSVDNLECSDANVSEYVKQLYGNTFICSSIKDKTFYFFNGNNWVLEDGNYNLRMKIVKEVKKTFEAKRRAVRADKNSTDGDLVNANSLVNMVSSGQDLKCLELFFYNPEFAKTINTAENLLVFTNGVFELDTNTFRKGRQEDYMVFTTGYDYNPSRKDYSGIHTLIESIFPDKIDRDYIMKVFCSYLFGRNKEEFCYIFTGSGSNGKGLLQDIFTKGLGEYFLSGRTSIITGNREESGSANSSVMALKGKRLVVFPESNTSDKLNVGTIKQFSGGDLISARGLYKSEETFLPTFKMAVCCNNMPELDNVDGGIKRRLKVIEFKQKFVVNPTKPWERKIDPSLKNKENLKKSGEDFIHMLIQDYLGAYIKEGLYDTPESIDKYTNEYFDSNDIIKTCCDENIIESPDGFLYKSDLKTIYNTDKDYKVFKFPAFSKMIERHLNVNFVDWGRINGKSCRNYIKGFCLKRETLDDSETV